MTSEYIMTVKDVVLEHQTGSVSRTPINFSLQEGEIIGVYGYSGAGKTSLAKIIASLNNPLSGHVYLYDVPIDQKLAKQNIAYLSDTHIFPDHLNGFDALKLSQKLYGDEYDFQKLKDLALNLGVDTHILGQKIETYTPSMKQKLALMTVFLSSCPVLVLDHPFEFLDALSANLVVGQISIAKNLGQSIILTSNRNTGLLELCDHLMIMHKREAVISLSMEEFVTQMDTTDIDEACLAIVEQYDLQARANKNDVESHVSDVAAA